MFENGITYSETLQKREQTFANFAKNCEIAKLSSLKVKTIVWLRKQLRLM